MAGVIGAGAPAGLKRVLYVTDLGPLDKFGSLEEVAFILAGAFRERGSLFLPVFRYPLSPEVAAMYRRAGLSHEVLDLSRFDLVTLRELTGLVRRHRIDLVHWNLYHPMNPYLWALTVVAPRTRHWMTDHFSRPPAVEGDGATARPTRRLRRLAKRILMHRYDRVLCVSRFVLDSLRAQGITRGLSPWLHAINTDRFAPDAEERARLRRATESEKQFVVLCVAYLIPEKGIDVALRALADLPERVVLWVVGDGEEAARLHQLTGSLSLQDRVRFWGQQRNVEPFMQAADCFVCPSVWKEAAGLVVVEALACGLPVVASAVGGIPEFVDDGRNGFLCPPGVPAALADRIRRLLDDGDRLDALRAAARSTALAQSSVAGRLDEYLELYRS